MSRLEIKMPEFYPFKHEMKIRNTDIAKDNHVSFASILDIVFEAHLRFFKFLGSTNFYKMAVNAFSL